MFRPHRGDMQPLMRAVGLILFVMPLLLLLSACAEQRHNEFVTCIQPDGATSDGQHEGYKAGCTG